MAKAKPPRTGPYLVYLDLIRKWVPSFDEFPFTVPALNKLERLTFHPKVTFFVGENGSGKSLLLESLAVQMHLNPEGGSRNFHFATKATHVDIDRHLRVGILASPSDAFFLRAESFYNVASQVEELGVGDAYGPRSPHQQSHGESFMALMQYRIQGSGFYLMDEPEAALSPRRQLEFLSYLHRFCQMGGQFVIATHSPILMAYPNALIYEFGSHGIREVKYEDTDHYSITRGFLANPKKMLDVLMDDAEE